MSELYEACQVKISSLDVGLDEGLLILVLGGEREEEEGEEGEEGKWEEVGCGKRWVVKEAGKVRRA